MKPKQLILVFQIFVLTLSVCLQNLGWQNETPPMPSQRLDPKIQKIV